MWDKREKVKLSSWGVNEMMLLGCLSSYLLLAASNMRKIGDFSHKFKILKKLWYIYNLLFWFQVLLEQFVAVQFCLEKSYVTYDLWII